MSEDASMVFRALNRPELFAVSSALSPHDENSAAMRPWLAGLVLKAVCGTASSILRFIRRSHWAWMLGASLYSSALDRLAAFLALATCRLARQTIPAYAQFLDVPASRRRYRRLDDFPETSKESFAKAFPLASQCRHGRVRFMGGSIDESSGSTGLPFNWLRSSEEQSDVQQNVTNYIRWMFPRENLFCINAFSMGAWGTGLNFTMAMHANGLVKSIGPDIGAITSTLKTFGPRFNYLITGYPPFLKNLCDELEARNFPFDEYRLYGLVGGEGITEALRDYLERRFRKVRSGYGASDVQLGIGAETDFTVALRKAIAHDRTLRYRLLGEGEDRVPMIFQYNPLEVFIEVNDRSELLFTVTNTAAMCPKPRYNLRDEGRILGFSETLRIIGCDAGKQFESPRYRRFRLPLLFLFGRSDSTVSVMGANIYPQDIEHGLYANAELARHIQRFCLTLEEHADLRSRATINLELSAQTDPGPEFRARLERELSLAVTGSLEHLNRDFANARHEDRETTTIEVRTFLRGGGPFQAQRQGIKHKYIVRASANA